MHSHTSSRGREEWSVLPASTALTPPLCMQGGSRGISCQGVPGVRPLPKIKSRKPLWVRPDNQYCCQRGLKKTCSPNCRVGCLLGAGGTVRS